jgi:hypothetical protein
VAFDPLGGLCLPGSQSQSHVFALRAAHGFPHYARFSAPLDAVRGRGLDGEMDGDGWHTRLDLTASSHKKRPRPFIAVRSPYGHNAEVVKGGKTRRGSQGSLCPNAVCRRHALMARFRSAALAQIPQRVRQHLPARVPRLSPFTSEQQRVQPSAWRHAPCGTPRSPRDRIACSCLRRPMSRSHQGGGRGDHATSQAGCVLQQPPNGRKRAPTERELLRKE